MSEYRIEVWDMVIKKYKILGKWNSQERAEIMMHKPYVKNLTRRLIKITEEILYVEKAKK